MKQTILVTGGTGFIGSHTTVELQQAGYDVVVVDNLSNSKVEVLDGIEQITGIRPAFEQVDLRDFAATEAVFTQWQQYACPCTLEINAGGHFDNVPQRLAQAARWLIEAA